MIPIEKEPDGLGNDFRHLYEHCYFCDTPTKYWHIKTNQPVCQGCSKTHKVSELEKSHPDYKPKSGTQKSPFGIGS